MKGQLTAEYLLLALVAMALVLLSVSALFRIRESSDRALELLSFRSSVQELHNAMEEVCAMGYGNSRSVYVGSSLAVSASGSAPDYAVTFTDGQNFSLSRRCRCYVAPAARLYGKTVVKNKRGKITLG